MPGRRGGQEGKGGRVYLVARKQRWASRWLLLISQQILYTESGGYNLQQKKGLLLGSALAIWELPENPNVKINTIRLWAAKAARKQLSGTLLTRSVAEGSFVARSALAVFPPSHAVRLLYQFCTDSTSSRGGGCPHSNKRAALGRRAGHLHPAAVHLQTASHFAGRVSTAPPSAPDTHGKSLAWSVSLTFRLEMRGSHDLSLGFRYFASGARRTQQTRLLTRLLV